MGIRYYAYPVHPLFAESAVADPRGHLDSDEFHQFFAHGDGNLPTLDLDKCWRQMQFLFGSRLDRPSRPAFQMVEGEVTFSCCGWYGFFRAVPPAAMQAIADDFALVSEDDIREVSDRVERPDEYGYVREMVSRGQAFTREIASRGMGMLYHIG